MIKYNTLEDGSLSGNGISSIPVGHRFYNQALAEVEAGDAEIIPYQKPSLDDLKDAAVSEVKIFATNARAKLTGYADQYQLAGWVGKSEIAKRVIAGTAIDAEIASIQAEVDRRGQGETVEELATKQVSKSIRLNTAAAIIDGLESAAITAIESTQTKDALDTLMASLLVDAESELNVFLGNEQ